jgi:hypothetical protein
VHAEQCLRIFIILKIALKGKRFRRRDVSVRAGLIVSMNSVADEYKVGRYNTEHLPASVFFISFVKLSPGFFFFIYFLLDRI